MTHSLVLDAPRVGSHLTTNVTWNASLAAPSSFVVVASRIVDADRLEVVLRGEHAGDLEGAKRHAVTLAKAVADRCGAPACADVLTHDGDPLYSFAVTGGAL